MDLEDRHQQGNVNEVEFNHSFLLLKVQLMLGTFTYLLFPFKDGKLKKKSST